MIDGWRITSISNICKINQSTYSILDKWEFVNYLDTSSIVENNIDSIQHFIIGKDKLPKKTTKAKKEEPVDTKAPAKASSNVDTEDLPLITTDPNVESFGKFVIIKNDDNSTRPYHFRLLANNGQILFESESYKTKPKSNSIIAFKKVQPLNCTFLE